MIVYIASCVENGGIYRCFLQENGELKILDKTVIDRPMYMTISGDKMYVILRAPFSDSNDSGVVSFDIEKDGGLTNQSEITSTKGEVACHITLDNSDIFCVNYVSGSVIKLPDTLVVHEGKGINEKRQDKAHTHYVGITPDNKYILVTDLGTDNIFVYDKNLKLYNKVNTPKGHGVRHLVFSEDGGYLFAVNELLSTVSVFEYDNGALKMIDTVSILPKDTEIENTAAAIRYKNGKIYASNRGHNSIAEVEFIDNRLHLKNTFDCFGKGPRDFDIVGNFIISTNEDSDNVTVIDENYCCVHEMKVEKPLCVVYRNA